MNVGVHARITLRQGEAVPHWAHNPETPGFDSLETPPIGIRPTVGRMALDHQMGVRVLYPDPSFLPQRDEDQQHGPSAQGKAEEEKSGVHGTTRLSQP